MSTLGLRECGPLCFQVGSCKRWPNLVLVFLCLICVIASCVTGECLLLLCWVLVSSVLSKDIHWKECLKNDLFCVKWDAKLSNSKSVVYAWWASFIALTHPAHKNCATHPQRHVMVGPPTVIMALSWGCYRSTPRHSLEEDRDETSQPRFTWKTAVKMEVVTWWFLHHGWKHLQTS